MVTRFGNILGSSGSVVEIMLRCVERGRPVPVTDPDATRFFMTGEEAASLVMKAAQIGEGGEVFWLDMGEPVRIGDLVDRLITLATPAGTPRVPVETIGLRPGEKMREELTNQGLEMKRTAHHRIWRARQQDVRAARGLPRAAPAGPRLRRGRYRRGARRRSAWRCPTTCRARPCSNWRAPSARGQRSAARAAARPAFRPAHGPAG